MVTWTETTADGQVSVRSSTGSYPLNRTTTTYITDGSTGINQTVNHYFNGSCLDGSGTIEFRASANRLERTGIVLSNNDNLYVNNGSNSKMSVQVWGYDE